jgi:hypothetical protein
MHLRRPCRNIDILPRRLSFSFDFCNFNATANPRYFSAIRDPTRTHAERGQTERSGEGWFGDLLRQRNSTVRPHAETSEVPRPGRAQRRRGIQGYPPATTVQLARTPKKAKPSAAARPSAAEKGGVRNPPPPDYDTTQNAHAQMMVMRSGEAERCGVGIFEGLGFVLVRVRVPMTATIQLAHAPKKPSTATTPSAAERGPP